jgi:glycosyltransferase involved in cell wall biosynthesis
MKKKNNPLVSVLINNYNNQKYCVQAVQSVLDQNYNNIEIIFYDDFSDDLSLNKIIELKNDKIRIIRNTTRGKNYSLNQMKAIFEAFYLINQLIILIERNSIRIKKFLGLDI